ncbi:nuclease-related domain-containing protein [Streptomyces sp. NPDC047014]|uniref:nuclease-related domain-containing protein n=1 Tax=Streptomyces sp. NPDC047014 TaxID=3155736 RepID=UPI0033C48A95
MHGLRVMPGGRPGGGLLYVSRPDGRAVAWYDRRTHRISVLADEHREAVLAVLRPYVTGSVTVGPPPVPTAADLRRLALPPDADLAPNRPGERLLGELEHGAPVGARTRHRLRADLTARTRMGDALDALDADGWHTLHDVPLPGLGILDHLLIGPAGVFCVRTVPARRQRATIGDLLLTLGRTPPRPDPRWLRQASAHVARTLQVPTTPTLALPDASQIEIAPTARATIRLLTPPTTTQDLLSTPPTLKRPEVETLFALSRDAGTWLGGGRAA